MARGKRRAQPPRQQRTPASGGTGGQPQPPDGSDEAEPTASPASARADRISRLRTLREARGSDVLIAYVTSTRPGLSTVMALDAVRRFADHLPEKRVGRLDLFLHTDGGDSIVPWRLMTYLREYADQVDVLVPH